jgi:hypothetical protein
MRQERKTKIGHTLHLSLGVNDDAGVVLEVDEGAVLPPPGLALPNDHGREHCNM